MATNNKPWSLESFVDALVVELDKTRETLAVKAINKPLTYSVRDMALDLHIFPSFDGEEVRFLTAGPGEQGASKISLQLASITDKQVRETSNPVKKDDLKIEQIDVDPDTKKTLRKMGVTSVGDLQNIEQHNVSIENVGSKKVNYTNLANMIQKSKRNAARPVVHQAAFSMESGRPVIRLEGLNLATFRGFEPVAVVNDRLARVLSYDERSIAISLDSTGAGDYALVLTLDPYCIVKLNVA